MKVMPVASPHMIAPTGAQTSTQAEARARAISMLQGASPQPTAHSHQINQNAIAPEDMSAIRPKSAALDQQVEAETNSVQEPTAPSEPPSSASKPDADASQEWAKLARQEKAIRQRAQQQDQALKAREAALAAKEAELLGKQPDTSKYIPKEQLKAEALRLLDTGELSYDEVTQRFLDRQAVSPQVEAQMNMLKQQIEELKQANEGAKKAQEEQQTQAYQAAVAQIKRDVTQLVNNDPSFETIKETGSVNDVVDLIERVYKADGYVMDVAEAAEEVENYLVEEAEKILKINKIKQKYVPQAQAASTQKTQGNEQTQPTMKTLTNANTSARSLSAKERAILAFRGEKF